MNEIIKEKINIEDMIYVIRGVQVMLDSDLAKLFEIETKRINEAVKNNPKKFPDGFSWRLTKEESTSFLVENFDQKNIETRGGRYKNPRVFTEHGVVMLSTILKSDKAIEMSIRITDAFVAMRHFIMENNDIYKSLNIINNKLVEYDKNFNYLFSKFDNKEKLLLEGQEFSAYMDILKIMKSAKKEIIVVDNYADVVLLDLIRKITSKVILITKKSDRLSDIEIKKYNSEYDNLIVIRNNSFHDRCIVIDKRDIYHLGTSINDAGSKIFMLIKVENEEVKELLLKIIDKIILES